MSIESVYEKLRATAEILVSGTGTIHERLAAAFANGLQEVAPDQDLPEDLQSSFRKIITSLQNAVPPGKVPEPDKHTLTDAEAGQLACSVLELLLQVARRRTA